MRIAICGSIEFTLKIKEIKDKLIIEGHKIELPKYSEKILNGEISLEEFKHVKQKEGDISFRVKAEEDLIKRYFKIIQNSEAILIVNIDKNNISNYIGGNTLIEMAFAHVLDKKIFLLNPIPKISYSDEIMAMNPIILNGDLTRINPKIEVEIRSFISKEQYAQLLEFFKQNSELVKEDFQETYYFDCEQDLRIQKNNSGSKIWMKKGKIHDDFREEIEIKTNKEDFDKAREIFSLIGLNTEIKWLRDRKQFNWNGIKVCLDYTKGYGYIIELEKICSESEKEKVLEELKQKLSELNIYLTPREEFEKQYNYYKMNWRKLIEDETNMD